MKWNGIVEKMKNGNGMGWEKWVIQTYGKCEKGYNFWAIRWGLAGFTFWFGG